MQKDLLAKYPELETPHLKKLRSDRFARKNSDSEMKFADAVKNAPIIELLTTDFNQATIKIGSEDEISDDERTKLEASLEAFIPWKKGPFNFFGIEIDSEWRSDLKWQRFEPQLNSLNGKRICDIGCHNGYFMYRMLAHNPEVVVGLDPYPKLSFAFDLMQKYTKEDRLHFELLGVEHMNLFPDFFDAVFCLGILYHHTDPIGLLRKIKSSMRKGSTLYVDCQGIPGEEPIAFVPRSKYAKARGFWFLPTKSCLEHWLLRSGFQKIEFFYSEKLSGEEQRTTNKWAPVDSLEQFLDPNDPTKTIEGYPAPIRMYCKASR